MVNKLLFEMFRLRSVQRRAPPLQITAVALFFFTMLCFVFLCHTLLIQLEPHSRQLLLFLLEKTEDVRLDLTWLPSLECAAQNLVSVIVVSVRAGDFSKRDAIRRTWAAARNFRLSDIEIGDEIATVFAIGRPSNAEQWNKLLQEQQAYHDLLLVNVEETYNNMGLKTQGIFQWQSQVCQGPRFFFNTDDDCIVIKSNLWRFLQQLDGLTSSIVGRCFSYGDSPVIRDKTNKNHVSSEFWPFDLWPPYCAGLGQLLTADVPGKLWKAAPSRSLVQRFGQVQDVFFSGILANDAKIAQLDMRRHFVGSKWDGDYCLTSGHCVNKDVVQLGEFANSSQMEAWWQKYGSSLR